MSASAQVGLHHSAGSESLKRGSRAMKFVREHRYMVGLLMAGAVLGAIAGATIPMGDLSLVRRVLGGAVAGFYFALFPLGFRLFE